MSGKDEAARPRAVIFGCAGLKLGADERRFFAETDPLGFILFRRNVERPAQVFDLVEELRTSVGRPDAPVLIDQEGGRVARLGPPHWPKLPPARAIGYLAEQDFAAGAAAARASGRVIGAMLAELGIDVACAPVADLLLPETHAVIGDRAYSQDPDLVAKLAIEMAAGLRDAGVTSIIKHIPGHGRATADSHLDLPRIDADFNTLDATDFATFRNASNGVPWAMVAHCVYNAIDRERPASISPKCIEVIRDQIGFDGVLIADDIGMKALQGTLAENAAATLAAGCDLTLHCSGDLAEMQAIAPAVGPLSHSAALRLEAGKAWLSEDRQPFDRVAEQAQLDALLA
ncbi:MAG TPA: beta-N-acetylhexosaminidase [Alphaproteobacteria bacterium]|nr:beta-N-acetylhexosaminidase [Alphaproteobacteria bacterium]